MPDDALVAGPSAVRTVYASRPTPRQKPLPFDGGALLRRYVAEAGLWADATRDLPPLPGLDGPWNASLRPGGRAGDAAGAPASLTVTVLPEFGSASVDVDVYDALGRRLVHESGFTGDRSMTSGAAKPPPERVPVALAPESRRFVAAFYSREDEHVPTPEETREFFDVARRDPLSYAVSDALFALAGRDETRGNLVVRADDALLPLNYSVGSGSLDLGALSYFEHRLGGDGRWTTLAPEWPVRDAAAFFPRGDLARALAIAARAPLAIEEQAAMALLYPDPYGDYAAAHLVRTMRALSEWEPALLRVYGAMTLGERLAARAPEGVAFEALRPEVRREIAGVPLPEPPHGALRAGGALPRRRGAPDPVRRRGAGRVSLEITAAAPSGPLGGDLPPGGRLRIADATDLAVRLGEDRYVETPTMPELALLVARHRAVGRRPDEDPPDLDHLVPITKRTLTFTFRLNPEAVVNGALTSEAIEGAPVRLADLAGERRRRYDAAFTEAVKMKFDPPTTTPKTIPPP